MTNSATPQLEIERKFRLPAMPPAELYLDYREVPCAYIDQAYLVISNEREVRIRRKGTRYFLTIKGPGALCREEVETEITKRNFEDLLPTAIGSIIHKYRYTFRNNGNVLEVDEYNHHLTGLYILECEFPSIEAAAAFHLPAWAAGAVEVTNDGRYKNKNLALSSTIPP